MTTPMPEINYERADLCFDADGEAVPFGLLPVDVLTEIVFCRTTGLALWEKGGEGMEPPPYWIEGRNVHTL